MTDDELVRKFWRLVTDIFPGSTFTVIIVEPDGSVTNVGYGCQRCMAPAILEVWKEAEREPHNSRTVH